MKLGELSSYISGLFGMEKGEICYRDNENKELISPSVGIVNMIIMNPRKYKNIVIGNKKRVMARFESLLKMFGLEDRLVEENVDINALQPIDYDKVYKLYGKLKEKSIHFLSENLFS